MRKINFRKPKIDYKSFCEVEMASWMASRSNRNTIFSIYMVCGSQKSKPCHCTTKNKNSPVKITRCIQMVKIEISVTRSILGCFWPKMSNKKLTFSSYQLSSRHCKPHFTKGCHTVPYQGIRFFEKKFHPAHVPYGGMFLEVGNLKNRTPEVVFHPNTIFKSHHFD